MKYYQIKFTMPLEYSLDCEHCPYCTIKCRYYSGLPNYHACCIKGTILFDYPNHPDWCPAKEIENE